jgi:pathogenesis-related protein 1
MIKTAISILGLFLTVISFAQKTDFEIEILGQHNEWRNEYGITPLTWSKELASKANKWAIKLAEEGCKLQHDPSNHSGEKPNGENIYAIWGSGSLRQDAVDSWASERLDYDFATNTCKNGKVCGHFTQLIWENTKEVGCAMVSGNGCKVVVCKYLPAGNYIGQRPIKNK